MASQEGTTQDQTVDEGIDDNLRTHTIGETLARLPECTALSNLVERADASYLLRRSGLHTLFAPVNEALKQLSDGNIEAFLTRHMLSGSNESSDLEKCSTVKTTAGEEFPVVLENGFLRIGPAKVVHSDIACTNGVIHIVDRVLITSGK